MRGKYFVKVFLRASLLLCRYDAACVDDNITTLCPFHISVYGYGIPLKECLDMLAIFFGLVGLVSLFNGISTLCRLSNTKAIPEEEQ